MFVHTYIYIYNMLYMWRMDLVSILLSFLQLLVSSQTNHCGYLKTWEKPGRCGLRNHWTYWPPVLDVLPSVIGWFVWYVFCKKYMIFPIRLRFQKDGQHVERCHSTPIFVSFWSYIGLHADTSPRSATYQTSLNTYIQWQHIKPRMIMKNRHLGIM